MSKTIFKIGLGVLALAGLVWPAAAAMPGETTLKGHVPAIVSQLHSSGQLPSNTNLQLVLSLPLRNQTEMQTLLQQVYDPSSTNYHHFITPTEFSDRFGPTTNDYQAVVHFAQTNGFTIRGTTANRMLLEVDAHVSDIHRAFGVNLKTYQHPTENRTFFAPDTEPVVPASLPLLDVRGLNNYVRPHPKLLINPTNTIPRVGSGPGGSFMGKDFRAAYVPGTTLDGSGQSVALVQFDGYLASDIVLYEQAAGLPHTTLTNILLNGFSGNPTGSGGEVEVSLDIEMVISMATNLNKILVYEGDPFNFFPNVVLNRIAQDNAAKQISCSWGWIGGPNASSEQIFQQMALQGQSFYNASGDSDAFLPGEVDNPGGFGFPSCSPNITQVGGTTLTTAGPGGNRVSEKVWNWGGGTGSSGGYSSFYGIPSWQQWINMSTNHGSATGRNIPDVALTADNVFVIADGGVNYPDVGGTSCAAPLWAGYTALINQQAALNSRSPVGFINPAIYALAQGSSYASTFHDITNGDNTWSSSPTNFYAVPGYDLCTGLGTPNGTNLIFALTGGAIATGPVVSAPRPPYGTTLSAMNGSNPNGSWFLFVEDDKPLDVGVISNGWSVALTSANPVGSASDSQVLCTSSATSIGLGGDWTVTVAVTNYGPSIATNVIISDELPVSAGMSLVSTNPSVGSIVQFGPSLFWSLGNLANNAGGVLNLSFHATALGIYTNNASVSSATTDPNPDDDTAGAIVNVVVQTPATFAGVTFAGGQPTFSVTNSSGSVRVVLEASTNLANANGWQPIYTNNTTPFNYTDVNATNFLYRFYRLVVGGN